MDVKRITRTVQSTDVDAWVIYVASREVLQWFAERPEPAFALAGRLDGVPIAGVKPNMPEAYAEAARHLVKLGHRRIVLLCRSVRRLPEPGRSERAFLEALEENGITTGSYNLPNWEDSPDALHSILDSLFQVTPPTALLIDEPLLYTATRQSLSARGLQIPGDVSLICTTNDPTFAWCRPPVAHFDYDPDLIVRRMVRWVANVSRGREDKKQTTVPATFIAEGSVATPPRV
jgi:DNA-binding LacI/PurR family transcriptional regulator